MTMKAHTYYLIFGRQPIGGSFTPLSPWRRPGYRQDCVVNNRITESPASERLTDRANEIAE